MHSFIHTYLSIHTYIPLHIKTSNLLVFQGFSKMMYCMHMHVCVYVCVCVNVTYIHTYTHTHSYINCMQCGFMYCSVSCAAGSDSVNYICAGMYAYICYYIYIIYIYIYKHTHKDIRTYAYTPAYG
jgi:hypothetical protein